MGNKGVRGFYTGGGRRMICENCGIRPASVQVLRQQGDRRVASYFCTQCARQLGMIGGSQGGNDPFAMLQNLIQQQQGGQGSLFDALSAEAQQAVMRAREASAGTTRTAAIGTDHLLAGIVTGDNVATEALQRAGADVTGMRARFQEFRGDPGEEVYTFTPSAKRALQLSFTAARQMGAGQVGSEHLLLLLLGEGDGNAYRILQQHGASDAEALRREILRLMQQRQMGPGMPGAAAGGPGGGQQGPTSKTPTLDQVSRDLTQLARDGELDPVIGRAEEISRVVRILSRRTKNNPVLIGEAGVGKTAVAEGLAQRIVSEDIPESLKSKRVLALDVGGLVAGTRFRGDFEERMQQMLKELQNEEKNIILFIDELHSIVGAGGAEGAVNASNMLKPALARGELQVVGATTLDEYRKHVEKDPALERRFQPVLVSEPTVDEAVAILFGLRDRYEAHHRVRISDEALIAAAGLSDRYISDRFLPDKAIDLLDEAGARMRIRRMTAPPDLREFDERIAEVRRDKESAIDAQDFERAAQLRDKEKQLLAAKSQREKQWKSGDLDVVAEVDDEQIAEVLANWTGIPVFKLTEEETTRLLRMEDELHKRIIGQEEAIKSVSQAIRRTRAGLKDPKRPSGSFIFAGPSGVGKTELSKALAEFLFGSEDALIQIDMGEFHDRFTASRLFGAPPGYVGYEEGGQLTDKVRRKPFSVVLFDEIEKAHQEIYNSLLQVLEDGRLTDGQGRIVDFKNTVLIMTTNLGTRDVAKAVSLGFQASEDTESNYERMKQKVNDELKQHFRPEFLNRIDDTIVFHQLSEPEILSIVDLMIARIETQLRNKDMGLELTDNSKKFLAKKGWDPVMGARPLRRTIQREIEDSLSERILFNEIRPGQIIVVDCEGDPNNVEQSKLVFRGAD